MSLKKELYSQDDDLTLAQNIDKAWEIYIDENKKQEDREVAQGFLIYAFDIKHNDNLNQQLLQLMDERNQHKAENPEYIPGLSPKQLKLKPDEMSPDRTIETKVSPSLTIDNLFKAGEMLDVNARDKIEDMTDIPPTPFLFAQDRAKYRVHIYQGNFCKKNELFSTDNYIAHGKKKYGAYTINANGELSIFDHYGQSGKNLHSSMNAGSPVVCAGELCIENGKLTAINTYSGHYQPSLFNVYRALEYFYDKGIDLSEAKVQVSTNPAVEGLKVSSTIVSIPSTYFGWDKFYETPASEFFNVLKAKLNKSLNNIQTDIQSYQSSSFKNILFAIKDTIIQSTLTKDRMDIAVKMRDVASKLMEFQSDDFEDNTVQLDSLIKKLVVLKDENNQLSVDHGKDADNGRLHQRIETFIQQATALQSLKKPDIKDTDLAAMHKIK